MTLRSLVWKLRVAASLQWLAGSRSRPVASQDKMSSSAFARTTDRTAAQVESSYDERLRSAFQRWAEMEARRQWRSLLKTVFAAEVAALATAFVGLCYVADNNRV